MNGDHKTSPWNINLVVWCRLGIMNELPCRFVVVLVFWMAVPEKRVIDLHKHRHGQRSTKKRRKPAKLFIDRPSYIIAKRIWCATTPIAQLCTRSHPISVFLQPMPQILRLLETYWSFTWAKCRPKPSKNTINHQCGRILCDWSCFGQVVGRSWCRQKYDYSASSSSRIVMVQHAWYCASVKVIPILATYSNKAKFILYYVHRRDRERLSSSW